ncbi:MAG TPA: tetratricopeptide repeat protein [Herpetosiphonaceae bacterium]|nr:tetratricopeptide repeat protein [Herpetosiphonaceae bacterium]
MTRQDERMRLKKRLLERAVELSTSNRWEEAIATNEQLLQLGEDTECYNRIGKAYLELGRFEEAQEAYNNTLQLNPSNVIARKNLARLKDLAHMDDRGLRKEQRTYADPQLFIIETGKTALTTLTNVPGREIGLRLVSGEQVELQYDDKTVTVIDSEGRTIGQFEPLLAQRLIEMHNTGSRYAAAIANLDGNQIKVLIREIFQSPDQRHIVSFPGKLGGDIAHFRTYIRDLPTRYELDGDDMLEDEELGEEDLSVEVEDDFFRGGTGEEEEVRLEELETELSKDDEDEDEA